MMPKALDPTLVDVARPDSLEVIFNERVRQADGAVWFQTRVRLTCILEDVAGLSLNVVSESFISGPPQATRRTLADAFSTVTPTSIRQLRQALQTARAGGETP